MEAPRSERAALPRDVSEFLLELSIALHRHTMYPSGHPSLEPASNGVVRAAEQVLHARASLAIGVSRRQLLVDEVSTDPNQPVLRRLADALHRHHIGAVSVTPGLQPSEIADALRRLARDPERDGALAATPDAVTSWPHLKLHPLTFDRLSIGDEGADAEGRARSRPTDLWAGLARAALALDIDEGGQPMAPAAIARAINGHAEEGAYDQPVVRYLLEIAHELTTATADNAAELHEQTMELIGALDPATLRRLVGMGGDTEQRHQFVRDAAHGMAADAVLEIVKAAADAGQQTISHGLLRMLSKLAGHAKQGSELARPRADSEFRQQVGRLLDDWTLIDPNPQPYGRVLERLAASAGDASAGEHDRAEASASMRVVQMSLESNVFPPLAARAIDDIVKLGRLNELFEVLAAPPSTAASTADAMLAQLTSPEAVTALLAQDRIDMTGLDALLPRLSIESFGPLLDAIGSSPSRAVRRRLLDWLAQSPVDIGPLVIARLNDQRWYVQRNMLVLLQRSGRIPAGFSPGPWTRHPDARVRTEAIRLQVSLAAEKMDGVRAALNDNDPRVVRLGLAAMPPDCPDDVIDRVIDWAIDVTAADDLRQFAVTTLGRFRDEAALSALLHLADGGRTWFGRPRLPAKTPLLIAVLRALNETWRDNARAARVRAVAARSSDPDIRQAVS